MASLQLCLQARDAQLDSLDISGATAEEIVESLAKFRQDVPHAPNTFAIIVEVRLPGHLGDALEQQTVCGVPISSFAGCTAGAVQIGLGSLLLCLDILCWMTARKGLGSRAQIWGPCAVVASGYSKLTRLSYNRG